MMCSSPLLVGLIPELVGFINRLEPCTLPSVGASAQTQNPSSRASKSRWGTMNRGIRRILRQGGPSKIERRPRGCRTRTLIHALTNRCNERQTMIPHAPQVRGLFLVGGPQTRYWERSRKFGADWAYIKMWCVTCNIDPGRILVPGGACGLVTR